MGIPMEGLSCLPGHPADSSVEPDLRPDPCCTTDLPPQASAFLSGALPDLKEGHWDGLESGVAAQFRRCLYKVSAEFVNVRTTENLF